MCELRFRLAASRSAASRVGKCGKSHMPATLTAIRRRLHPSSAATRSAAISSEDGSRCAYVLSTVVGSCRAAPQRCGPVRPRSGPALLPCGAGCEGSRLGRRPTCGGRGTAVQSAVRRDRGAERVGEFEVAVLVRLASEVPFEQLRLTVAAKDGDGFGVERDRAPRASRLRQGRKRRRREWGGAVAAYF